VALHGYQLNPGDHGSTCRPVFCAAAILAIHNQCVHRRFQPAAAAAAVKRTAEEQQLDTAVRWRSRQCTVQHLDGGHMLTAATTQLSYLHVKMVSDVVQVLSKIADHQKRAAFVMQVDYPRPYTVRCGGQPAAQRHTMRMATALSRSPRSLMLWAKAFSASLLLPICISIEVAT
jgi:hypothetical protein